MGARVYAGSTGKVTFTHRKGSAIYANGLAVILPVYEVLATSSSSTTQTWTRQYEPGAEIVVRLLYNGSAPGSSAYDSTGPRARVTESTPTFLNVGWEDDSDNDYNDAHTTIDGGQLVEPDLFGGWYVGQIPLGRPPSGAPG